mmetsp:Transcript_15908/g.23788  ORF Transcript_15908/g.23788 Transcript_15908/m.23788 type:complete len:395 (-) Transcript_15908:132-1316(-)
MATVEGEAVRSGRRRRRRALINSSSKRTSRGMMMILLFSTVLFIILTYTHGEDTTATASCSCSPRAFLFKLDLATGFCPQVYPASNLFGSGVKDYTCRISLSPNNENGDAVEAIIDPPRIIQKKEAVVNSVQFIEVDTKFNVLHTSLVKDVELISGDSFRYTTMQQGDKIAGGISIILRGKNAVGDESENVFTVTYTNECGVPTFQGGEKIGWVTVENLIPASGTTCENDATLNASSSSSTATPTVKPSVPSNGGAIQRTPDVILKEVLKLVNDEGDNLFSDVRIPPGFAFLVEQALAAYYDSLIFDAIYRTTDASKLLACDKAEDNNSDSGASKSLICGLLSEALCGLAMDIGEASIGESVRSPTFHPSSGATTTVAIGLTSPPTIVARPVQD